ncbi:hypothetical protein FGO68_gene2736 [Halteria grandinella]|uniref:Uncharacterized protein n=1 Tax=Halteria grandinella TaxID=5974 RepID=A0A8J8T842_HALGN|nr:hypothetical protein FGO68_gene2736 [Halteria grandinella]
MQILQRDYLSAICVQQCLKLLQTYAFDVESNFKELYITKIFIKGINQTLSEQAYRECAALQEGRPKFSSGLVRVNQLCFSRGRHMSKIPPLQLCG